MTRDTLFLLAPGIHDRGRREYCPECAEVWGVLHYYPALKETLDIRYQPVAHPRAGIVALLGEGRWNCPTLVLSDEAPGAEAARLRESNGRRFIDNARDIGKYFAEVHGVAWPRGS